MLSALTDRAPPYPHPLKPPAPAIVFLQRSNANINIATLKMPPPKPPPDPQVAKRKRNVPPGDNVPGHIWRSSTARNTVVQNPPVASTDTTTPLAASNAVASSSYLQRPSIPSIGTEPSRNADGRIPSVASSFTAKTSAPSNAGANILFEPSTAHGTALSRNADGRFSQVGPTNLPGPIQPRAFASSQGSISSGTVPSRDTDGRNSLVTSPAASPSRPSTSPSGTALSRNSCEDEIRSQDRLHFQQRPCLDSRPLRQEVIVANQQPESNSKQIPADEAHLALIVLPRYEQREVAYEFLNCMFQQRQNQQYQVREPESGQACQKISCRSAS